MHILIIVFSVTTLVALPGIMHLYNLSDDAMTFTKQIIWYHGICCMLIWPEAFTLPNTLRAASDVKFCMILSIISMWVFRIAFSYIIAVMTIDWAVRAVLFIIRYRGKRWQHKSIA